ncbi:hypothetical protein COZ22_00025, partial [bacterium (Candidatus Howlettbacteria) CG_4_10_14_3_um_filter_37_10]
SHKDGEGNHKRINRGFIYRTGIGFGCIAIIGFFTGKSLIMDFSKTDVEIVTQFHKVKADKIETINHPLKKG